MKVTVLRRGRVLLAFGLLAFCATTPASAQMEEPVWKKPVTTDGWLRRMPDGTLLLGTRESLSAIDPATGNPTWTRTDLGGLSKQAIDPLQSPVALVNVPRTAGPSLRAIDLRDGRDRWNVAGLSLGHWPVPSKQALLIYLWKPTDRVNEKEFGGRMTLLRLDDGQPIWEDPAFFSTWPADRNETWNLWRVQGPVFDTDSTMVTFMSAMGVRRWHLGTGRNLWAAELKLSPGAASPYYGYAPLLADRASGKLFVPLGLGLASVDLATGAIGMRARLRGIPRQTQVVPEGLLVRAGSETVGRHRRGSAEPIAMQGSDFIVLLDPATGEKRWKDEVRVGPDATNFVVRGDKVYVATGSRIVAIDVASGTDQVLAKYPGFKNDDAPSELVVTDAGFLLRGETNAMFLDNQGKVVHHTAFKRPGRSVFVKAVASGLQLGAARAAASPTDLLGPLVRSGAIEIGDADELRKRTTQTVHAGMRSAFYAEVKRPNKEDNGFVFIDAASGQIVGDVITAGLLNAAAFAEKNVDLAFDLEKGWLHYFLRSSGNSGKFTGELGGWRVVK